jgi:hypothetical protein
VIAVAIGDGLRFGVPTLIAQLEAQHASGVPPGELIGRTNVRNGPVVSCRALV